LRKKSCDAARRVVCSHPNQGLPPFADPPPPDRPASFSFLIFDDATRFVGTEILKSMPERVLRALEEKVPLGRLGRPEEIANTFAWLASDEASYVNGAVLEVTGGLTI